MISFKRLKDKIICKQYFLLSKLVICKGVMKIKSNEKFYSLFLKLIFVFLFIIISIRFDFGNDYLMYKKEFTIINSKSNSEWLFGMNRLEYGWIYLNKLFYCLDFKYLIIFLSLIYCTVYYLFIKNILSNKLYLISTLIFLISPGIFLIHQSVLRQSLALSFFILAILLVKQKFNFFWSLLIVIIACFFHSSAVVLIPLLLTQYININKTYIYIVFLVYFLLYVISYYSFFSAKLFDVIEFIFPKYSIYLKDDMNYKIKINSGLGIAASTFNFFLILYYFENFNKEKYLRIIFFSAIMYFLLSPLTFIIGQFGRLVLYFEVFKIITIPIIFYSIKNKYYRVAYLVFNIAFSILGLFMFLNNDIYKAKFGTYKTIFSNESRK